MRETGKSTQQSRIRREQFINRSIDNLGWNAMLRITKLAKQNNTLKTGEDNAEASTNSKSG